MISLWALAVSVLAVLGAGCMPVPLIPSSTDACGRFAFRQAIGLAVVSLAIFALGVFQLWSTALFSIIAVVLSLAGVWRIVTLIRGGWKIPRPAGLEWAAGLLILALLGLTLVCACAPVTDWDGLSYHLAVPKLYLRHGGIYWIDFIHHSNFPFAAEMLFAPAVALKQPSAAKVVHWAFFALSVLAAGLLAEKAVGRRTGTWAALAFASVPVAIWEAGTAYIDLATAAFTLLSCLALLYYFEKIDRRALALSGFLAGMSAGTKTFNLVWIVLAALWVLYERRRQSNNVQDVSLFLVMAVAVCCPWYIKSFIMTGNPVYPFLYHFLGGKGWSESGAAMYRDNWIRFGMGKGLMDFLRLPWDFMAHGNRYIDSNSWMGAPGAVLAALLPAAALRITGRTRALALIVVVWTLVWFGLSQQSRYLLPVLALAVVLGCAAVSVEDLLGRAGKIALLAIGTISVYASFILTLPASELMEGKTDVNRYVSAEVPVYPLINR